MKTGPNTCGLLVCMLMFAQTCQAECTLDVQSVLLGSYDTVAGSAVNGIGEINVQCTPAASYTLSLSTGQGSYASRELHSGLSEMNYNLYLDPSHTQVWGDGSGATSTAAGNTAEAWHTVYGRIDAGQHSLPAGTYTDQLMVTVEF